ncbi:uncharacterized protein [Heptranchias perlo]|uniref:uncharacterized protein n=1 Tax=Heptranchias perlo TaxID=212740 RepID=UPI00355A8AE9
MAAESVYQYSLLIEGDWSPDIAKLLKTKLQIYFQSRKKSNGGDCIVEYEDPSKNQAVVRFASEQIRCRVLEKEAHEIDLQQRGKVHFTVRLLPQAAAGGDWTAATQLAPEQYDLNSVRKQPKIEKEKLAEQNLFEEHKTLIVIPSSDNISDEHVQKYFENDRSGGGPLTSFIREDSKVTLTFENAENAQAVLSQEAHSVDNVELMVRKFHDEKSNAPPQSSAVVLQNLPENVMCDMLNLLVENLTGLTEEADGFSMEMLSEMNAAVVTFKTEIDLTEFIKRCSTKVLSGQQKIVAKQLEVTDSVKVENLPSNTSEDFLKLYFESPKCGRGIVTTVEITPEESAAVVSFENSDVLDTILSKTHIIDKTPIQCYLYYKSLGSALYGNKRPIVKMPDPFTVDINPYILQFLKNDGRRIAEINDKMSVHYCNIAMPESDQSNSIKISPTFSRHKGSFEKLAKNWKREASGNLKHILSKYKANENDMNQQIWEIIQSDLDQHLNQNVAVTPDILKGKVILAGESDSVDTLQQTFKSVMDSAIEKLEREKQSVTETVSITPARYSILLSDGLEQKVSKLFPNLSMKYNSTAECIALHGLPSEVYVAKSNILEGLVQMKQKQADINPHLISFLQRVGHSEVSCCLFTSNGINAVYDIKDNYVLLIGNTDSSVSAAEKEITKLLDFKCIEIEDRSVIGKSEWTQLKEKLDSKLNSSSKQIEIEEIPLNGHVQIIISGFSGAVTEVFEMLKDFVKKHTIIEKTIPFKSGAVLQFLMAVKKIDIFQKPPMGVKIKITNMANDTSVLVSGPQENVCQVEKLLSDAVSTVVSSVLKVTNPGTKKFFKEKEDVYVTAAMHKFNCVLRPIEHGVFGDDGELGQAHCKVQLPGGPIVVIYRGDLCKCHVDVVVNAANEDLKHIGGLAGALLEAAGPVLQNECNRIVNKYGCFMPGDAVITDAGNLPCSKVIHAVGPRWMSTDADTAKKCLRRAVKQSLCLSETHNLKSIAIPAISSGIFGFPLPLCAEIIVRSIREYCVDSPGGSTLKEIHLANRDEKTVRAVLDAVQKILGEFISSSPVMRNRISVNCLHKTQTKDGLNIVVVKGNIQDVTAAVIVNVIGMDLDLKSGAVSQAILQKAGPKLQQLLWNESQSKKHAIGRIYETKGCKLDCDEVFHVVVPHWDRGNGDAEKVLQKIIKECLKNTEALQLGSIAFPAIGAGKLCFPKDLVARMMFEEVLRFSSKRSTKYLKNVHFVVHPDDVPTVKAMSCEFKRTFNHQPKMTLPTVQQRPSGPLFGRLSSPTLGHAEIQVGPILLQVITGDITKETTDVIVNSSNNKFTLRTGVSKAILDAAGQTVVDECQQLGLQPNSGIIMTNPGDLQCQNIIHMIGQKYPSQIKAFVGEILQECEQNKFTSVSFPALGTGQGGANPSQVADAMIDSVAEFAGRKSPTSLHKIRFVIFQPQMLNEFSSSMQKCEGSNLPETESLWKKAKNAVTTVLFGDQSKSKDKQFFAEEHIVLEDQIEPALFEICGSSKQIVESTKSWLEKLILTEQDDKVISSDYIFQFSEKEREELNHLHKSLQIKVELECNRSGAQIKVCGLARDVLTAYSKIQEMVNNIRGEESRRRDEELISNLLEWQFQQGTQFISFDSATNLKLEKAFNENKTTTDIELRGRTFTVELRKDTAVDNQGNKITLKRVLKTEGLSTNSIPNHWDDMQTSQYRSVQLQQQSKEYQDVEKSFKTGSYLLQIVKIERLQNLCLWKNYMIKKQLLEEKNPVGTNNERILFHGTAPDTLDSINHHGFNRSYAGRNATMYGNGTYFAIDANYSAQETYSRSDLNGFKYIYRARVLTGVYCRGQGGMVIPPSKNSTNPTDLYDSVTDNVSNPSMFIIFNDIQAYPEYLITFKLLHPSGSSEHFFIAMLYITQQATMILETLTELPVFYQDLIKVWNMVASSQNSPPSGTAATLQEPLLRNPHLRVVGFRDTWLAERMALAAKKMAAESVYQYSLLIEGDWSPDIAKLLKTKLQIYFQSRKKSNGGDCIVEYEDPSKNQAVVRFASEQIRCRVLEKKVHEIDLQKKGKVHVTVRLLQDEVPQAASGGDQAAATQLTSEQYVWDSANKWRKKEKDAQAVLSQGAHSVENVQLAVKFQDEKNEAPSPTSSVVLQNLNENIACDMLNLLVENLTGLIEEAGDFSIELLSEINAAVVTFKTSTDLPEFVQKCSTKVMCGQKIVAKQLDRTKSVRVENLPSNTSEGYLKLYFETAKNGNGNVTTIEITPEESAAVVSFENFNVLDTILSETHIIDKTPIHVYPYYKSLGSAFYGNKRPIVKMPDPFTVDINPYILQFLKNDGRRIAEINDKMSVHYCDIAMPESDQANSIKISPTVSRHEGSLEKLAKNWKREASGNLMHILSKYKAIENDLNQQIWEVIQGDLDRYLNQNVAVIPDILKGKVIVAGESDSVDTLQQTFKSVMDSAIEKLEREKQSVTETVSIAPARYSILLSDGLEQKVSKLFPNLSMKYNSTAGCITLHGLPSDVYVAKSKILEGLVQMKQKQADMNPHLISFLQRVDHNEVSCCLFTSNGINAVYDIKDNYVLLIGNTDSSVSAAEKQIKKHLDFKCIEIEDRNVIGKSEWTQLKEKLDTRLNSSSKQIEIEEIPVKGDVQIIISGYSDAVMEAFEMLKDFVQKNTYIEKTIPFKSGAVLQFLMAVKKMDIFQNPPMGVKIKITNMANDTSVLVSGPQENVCQVEKLLSDAVSTVVSSVLKITNPGTKKFFKEKEDVYVTAAMHKFNCVLRPIEHGVFGDDGELGQAHCKVQLPGGPIVVIYRGDLCKCHVDVVVNAANEDLKHIGGLAGALLEAAGPVLQNECNRIVNKYGCFMPGDAVITDAGNLPCSKVIHAVGPRWMSTDADTAKKCLRRAVKESLCLAETYNLKSIAIPAISSGIFGFPLPLCAEIIVRSIREHCVDSPGGNILKEIHLVNRNEKTVRAVSDAVQKILGEFTSSSPAQPERLDVDSVRNRRNINCLHDAQTKEGLNILVVKGNIQDATTAVIVNTTGTDLNLASGAVSRAISQKAGPQLQQLLWNEKRGKAVVEGKVYQTKGCNLNCDEVFHVVVPHWDRGNGDAEKVLRKIIKECLKNTEALQLGSIAFPAIGTGNLCFPKDLVARMMFEQVLKFTNRKHLKAVHFIVHPSDDPTVQALSEEFKRHFNSQPVKSTQLKTAHNIAQQKSSESLSSRISLSTLNLGEMKIGQILLQVVTGDITKESTDVIVNSSNNNFTLKAGVSMAILNAAGQAVEDECQQMGSQPNQGIIMTNSGNLQCQKIIHIIGTSDPDQIKAYVGAILQTCEQNKFSSIAFPALGTGQGGVNPSQVADAMVDSVADFANRKSLTSLHHIRIVIFQPQMLNKFYNSLQKLSEISLQKSKSSTKKSAVTTVLSGDQNKGVEDFLTENYIVLEDEIEPAIFEICGDNKQNIENTKSWMEDLILKEQSKNVISNECIAHFSEEQHQELKELQKNLQIKIEWERKRSGAHVKVCGLFKDVLTANSKIQEMVNKVREEQSRRKDEELVSSLVEWQFQQGTLFKQFESAANFKLENAFNNNITATVIEDQQRTYTVDLGKKTAIDDRGNTITLKRVSKKDGLLMCDVPRHWDDMNGLQNKSVTLQHSSPEYQDVKKLFKATCTQFHISKIERLQNLPLWKNYMIRKQHFEVKNPSGTNNEMILFHGTEVDAMDSISQHGFNRSYAGRNATAYGTGTCFAVNASYSAQSTYSKPDIKAVKYIYQARVLTGVYCQGQSGMVVPPLKNTSNRTDCYDSVVDNTSNPSMFIIFNDIQAYPEYLITFK